MNTVAAGPSRRRDLAVVMARGRARRMGRPKGLLTVPDGTGESFVRRICSLYLGWAEVIVVVGQGQEPAYAEAMSEMPEIGIQSAPAGGGTARTVHLGWRGAAAAPSHVWAHPVDLPLVLASTIADLKARSVRHPDRIIRPVVAGRPGHPVILPAAFLESAAADPGFAARDLRDYLPAVDAPQARFRLLEVPSRDPGPVRDFDAPADLPPGAERP